ncbi:MAG: DinB family protein [Candidatus Kariarchaeaceae archaeon]|jgi:uncharacterized damage-inducible protein DinB
MSKLQYIQRNLGHTVKNIMRVAEMIIDKFPNEKLNYKPTEGSMPAGYMATHIYNMAYLYATGTKNGVFTHQDFDSLPIDPRKVSDKDEILIYSKKVKESIIECLDNLTESQLSRKVVYDFTEAPDDHFTNKWGKWELDGFASLATIMEETVNHRAQLNLYLRLLGLKTVFIYS